MDMSNCAFVDWTDMSKSSLLKRQVEEVNAFKIHLVRHTEFLSSS